MANDTKSVLRTAVLHPGAVQGEVLVLDSSLSFWGGFDPATGEILDRHHPQAGQTVIGKILVMRSSKGSAGTPAGVAESIRRRTGPAGVVLAVPDVNVAIGAMVAGELYGRDMPVLVASQSDYGLLRTGQTVSVDEDGALRIDAPS